MDTLNARLQQVLDDYVAKGIVGVSLALRTPAAARPRRSP